MNYKKPLNVDQQVKYLVDNKNIIVPDVNDSKETLTKCGYINLVTPFKHEFAEKIPSTKYECKKDSYGKHIYYKQSNFDDYKKVFSQERNEYQELYNGIHKFEIIYKSLVTNLFLVKHNVVNSSIATNILRVYENRIDNLVIHSSGGLEEKAVRKHQMKKVYQSITRDVNGYSRKNIIDSTKNDVVPPVNIYLVFDRLNLSQVNAIYFCMKSADRIFIYSKLRELSANLGAKNNVDFLKRVFNLVSLRNSVMHFNSLTILLKYSDYKNKRYRTRNSIDDYEAIIRALKYINKNVSLIA